MQSEFIEIQTKKEILLIRENYRDTLEEILPFNVIHAFLWLLIE